MNPQGGNRTPNSQPSQNNPPRPTRIPTDATPSTPTDGDATPSTPTTTQPPRQHPVLQYLPRWLISCGKCCHVLVKSFGEYCHELLISCRGGCYECFEYFCNEDAFKGGLYLFLGVGVVVGFIFLSPVIGKVLKHIWHLFRKKS